MVFVHAAQTRKFLLAKEVFVSCFPRTKHIPRSPTLSPLTEASIFDTNRTRQPCGGSFFSRLAVRQKTPEKVSVGCCLEARSFNYYLNCQSRVIKGWEWRCVGNRKRWKSGKWEEEEEEERRKKEGEEEEDWRRRLKKKIDDEDWRRLMMKIDDEDWRWRLKMEIEDGWFMVWTLIYFGGTKSKPKNTNTQTQFVDYKTNGAKRGKER